MAEPLKNYFGADVPVRVGESLLAVDSSFDLEAFVSSCLEGFDELELTPRARQIADVMAAFLPADRGRALDIVVDSLGPEMENCDPDDVERTERDSHNPMAGFFYMPHGYFIAGHGLDHFDKAMHANYELTKRFTAEFSIRPYLEHHTDSALEQLLVWATDPNVHVRRLVSEGSRPRLPWASRLKQFQADPAPVLELLELLKDDPVEYVRRSVANNLNDIAKDHPALVVEVAARWWAEGDDKRRRLVRHGLRTLIKSGDPKALDVLGFGSSSPALVGDISIEPDVVRIGEKVTIVIAIENPSSTDCRALVDLRMNFVKASGSTTPKVFKGAELELPPGESASVRKTISLAQHSTRTHYPGTHLVEVLVNGVAFPIGNFELLPPEPAEQV